MDSVKKGFGFAMGGCGAAFLCVVVLGAVGQFALEKRERNKIERLASYVRVGMDYNDAAAILGPATHQEPEPTNPAVAVWYFKHGIVVKTNAGKVVEVKLP